MKKYYLTVIALLLPLLASAYDAKIGGIYYNFNMSKRTAAVTSDQAQSYSGDVVIPSSVKYNGVPYKVTEIAPEAFFYCIQLTSVSLPEGLTSIGSAAFYYCEKLTSIIIPKNVETIGDEAFKQCTGLTSLVIPNKVTSIGRKAFSLCQNIRSVTLGSSVKTIGDEAFYGLWKLTSIAYLGSTPPTLGGSYVFGEIKKDDCTVWVPDGCMSAYTESGVLSGFSSIQMIPDGCVFIDGFNYYVHGTKKASVQSGPTMGDVVIPSKVVYDGEIYSVTKISNKAFLNTDLKSITIPESVTHISDDAFEGCTGLTSITIPESVTNIGYDAFRGCTSLASITIPKSVSFIGSNAFNGCTSLASISIPNGKIHMDTYVFFGTAWYDKQPDGLVYIGDLLYGYKGEMPANTSYDLRYGTRAIAGGAFAGYNGLTSIIIPGSVAYIGPQAFYFCTNLYDVLIHEGVEYIDFYAFERCPMLSLSIPNSVREILSGAFYKSRLSSVVIGNSVSYIGNDAFSRCTDLQNIVSLNSTPPSCSNADVFANVDFENCTLWVPKGSAETYMDDAVWGLFQRIRVYVKGDVTFDGKVDKNDLNDLVSYIMYDGDESIIGPHPRALVDINSDGNVNAADVVKLISLMK